MASYRSPGAPSEVFGILGTTHAHIDGAPFEGTKKIVEWFNGWGIRGKVDQVLEWTAGPQRARLPEIYGHHTAGEADAEDFGCFSTMLLDDKPDRFHRTIPFLVEDTRQFPGAVIEIEESFACMTGVGEWQQEQPGDRWLVVNPPHFGFFKPPHEALIEVHHAIDIEKIDGEQNSPLSLPAMMAARGEQLQLGGLFRFDKEHAHAVRTNSFASPDGIRALVKSQYAVVKEYLDNSLEGRRYRLRSLIEKVIGIKHIEQEQS